MSNPTRDQQQDALTAVALWLAETHNLTPQSAAEIASNPRKALTWIGHEYGDRAARAARFGPAPSTVREIKLPAKKFRLDSATSHNDNRSGGGVTEHPSKPEVEVFQSASGSTVNPRTSAGSAETLMPNMVQAWPEGMSADDYKRLLSRPRGISQQGGLGTAGASTNTTGQATRSPAGGTSPMNAAEQRIEQKVKAYTALKARSLDDKKERAARMAERDELTVEGSGVVLGSDTGSIASRAKVLMSEHPELDLKTATGIAAQERAAASGWVSR
jgi:hypothetical protein